MGTLVDLVDNILYSTTQNRIMRQVTVTAVHLGRRLSYIYNRIHRRVSSIIMKHATEALFFTVKFMISSPRNGHWMKIQSIGQCGLEEKASDGRVSMQSQDGGIILFQTTPSVRKLAPPAP